MKNYSSDGFLSFRWSNVFAGVILMATLSEKRLKRCVVFS